AVFSADRVDRIESSDTSISKWAMSSAARSAAIMASFSLAPLSRVTFSSLTIFSFTLSRSEFTVGYPLSNPLIAELARSAGPLLSAPSLLLRFPRRQKLRNWIYSRSAPNRFCHGRPSAHLPAQDPLVFQSAAGSPRNRGGMHVRKLRSLASARWRSQRNNRWKYQQPRSPSG